MQPLLRAALPALLLLPLTGCEYLGLLRPNVLKQLNPYMVRLVNELPRIDDQNEAIIGRLFAHGGLDHAETGRDGIMRANIRVPAGEYIWKPAIIVMDRPGELELDFFNEDPYSYHAVVADGNGDWQGLTLPIHKRGRVRVQFDQPGYYWFGCPIANHAGRGMVGLILVQGDVPAEVKLDRPKQKRP